MIQLLAAIIVIITIVNIFVWYFTYKYYKQNLEKIGNQVYNFGPRFIGKVDEGDYYKFSTDFLIEYKNYIDNL